MDTFLDPQTRAWHRFIATLDRAEAEGRPVQVFGLVGTGPDDGFYKLFVRVGEGRWWRATAGSFCQVSGNPEQHQARLDPAMALPSSKVFSGDVAALLAFKPTYKAPLGCHIEETVCELAGRWGNNIHRMGLAVGYAR